MYEAAALSAPAMCPPRLRRRAGTRGARVRSRATRWGRSACGPRPGPAARCAGGACRARGQCGVHAACMRSQCAAVHSAHAVHTYTCMQRVCGACVACGAWGEAAGALCRAISTTISKVPTVSMFATISGTPVHSRPECLNLNVRCSSTWQRKRGVEAGERSRVTGAHVSVRAN